MRSWMKATRSASFSSVSTTDACAMPSEASWLRLLTISGKREPRRAPDLAPHRKHREGGHRDAVIMHQRLRQILAARQHQAARIAAGIGNAQQFEIARDVLVVGGLAVELLEQIEDDVRLPALDRVADRLQLVLHAERPHLVAGRRATCSRRRIRSSRRRSPARNDRRANPAASARDAAAPGRAAAS